MAGSAHVLDFHQGGQRRRAQMSLGATSESLEITDIQGGGSGAPLVSLELFSVERGKLRILPE